MSKTNQLENLFFKTRVPENLETLFLALIIFITFHAQLDEHGLVMNFNLKMISEE